MRAKGKLEARMLSILLSVAMTVTVLPTAAMPVYAAENVNEAVVLDEESSFGDEALEESPEADGDGSSDDVNLENRSGASAPEAIQKEIGTSFDVQEIPAGGEVWYSFVIKDDEADYYFDAANSDKKCSFSLYKDADAKDPYFEDKSSASIYEVMDNSSIDFGTLYLKIKNTSSSEPATGRKALLAKAEAAGKETNLILNAGESKTYAYTIPASGDYDINLSSDKSNITITCDTKSISVAGEGNSYSASLTAEGLKKSKVLFYRLISSSSENAALKVTIEDASNYAAKEHGKEDGCGTLELGKALEADITAGVNGGKWYHFEAAKDGYYEFAFPSKVKVDLYASAQSIGKYPEENGSPIYLSKNQNAYAYVYTTDKTWKNGEKAKITVTETPCMDIADESKTKTITVTNTTEYIAVLSSASKSCEAIFSFENEGGGEQKAYLVNFADDDETGTELCKINGTSDVQTLKFGADDEYFIKIPGLSDGVTSVTVKIRDWDLSSAVSLGDGLGTITKGSCKWVKFTAPENGLYMINSAEASASFDCSYYIGSKDAGSVDELEERREDTAVKSIDYADFLEKEETVYILIKAKEADLTLSYLGKTVPERIVGEAKEYKICATTEYYFYYTAPKDMPFMALGMEYAEKNFINWELYSLDSIDDNQKIDWSKTIDSDPAAQYLSCPFGNIKKGDSYLLKLYYASGKDYYSVKLGAAESVETVKPGTPMKFDLNSEHYYAVTITEPGYYYLSHSSKKVYSSLFSGLGSTKKDAVYLIDEDEQQSFDSRGKTELGNAVKKYRHTTLFAQAAGGFGYSSMFKSLDGTAKLTPGTYYLKLRKNLGETTGKFNFVFDKVKTTISSKTDFETELKSDMPVVFEYAHDICKDKYFAVETENSVKESHFEIETKDVSVKQDGSKLEKRDSGEIYNAFEVVGVETDTKAKIVCSQKIPQAVLKDISVDTWSGSTRKIDSTIRASRSYEATFSGKKYEFDFGNHRDWLFFKVDVANSDNTAISDDFMKNHFVRVQLYKEETSEEFGHQDWDFDKTGQGIGLTYKTFDSVGENQSYRIRATLYNKADSSDPVAILISDNSKDESGEAVSNQIRTYGRVVIADTYKDEGKFTPVIGSNYVCLQFEYLGSDVSKILLREKGTEKYTVWSNFADGADRQSKWDACPQVESRKTYGYGLIPGTTYEILFLKNNNEYDKSNVGNTYFYEEDIITPQYKDGTPIEEPLTFTTKACGKAEVIVNDGAEGTVKSNSVPLEVVLEDWDTFFKYPYEDRMYFNVGFFNASKLKLEGKVKKDGATEDKAFACSVDVNTADGSGTVTWGEYWRWGDEANPKCEIRYNGNQKSTITVYYTLDELEAGTKYTVSDLKLTYFGKELALSDASKTEKTFTTKTSEYKFDYAGVSENKAYIGDFRGKVPVKVTASEGIIDTDSYDYQLKMELQDVYGNALKAFDAENGTTAEFDTLTYGALKPDTKYYIHTSLMRNSVGSSNPCTRVAEDYYSFSTASAKGMLTVSANGLSIVGTTAELTVDLSADTDAKDLLGAGKSLSGDEGVIHYYVKDITGKNDQPAAVQLDESSLTETAAPFTIKFENLKPNTKYVGYIADSAEGEHISECEFTTGNKEHTISVQVVPKITGGSLVAEYTGFENTEDLAKWAANSKLYLRPNNGIWETDTCKSPNKIELVDNALRFTWSDITWGAGNKYDYVIMLLRDGEKDPFTMSPVSNIEVLKSTAIGKDNVLVVENGVKTPAISPYEVYYDTTTPGGMKVSYSAADNENKVSVELITPGDLDKIKVVAQLAEEDDKGDFKIYSEGQEIKSEEAIFTKENGYEGELSFKNLRKNVTYYLSKVSVYADLTDTEEGYETLINTISYSEPDRAPMFISGTDETGVFTEFSVAGFLDRKVTGKDSDGKTIYRGYDCVQDEKDASTFTVAFEKKGDKYELKLADKNGNIIGDPFAWFDVRIVESRIASIVQDKESTQKYIELKKTGETKIIITPKSSEKYRQCEAKEITLKIKSIPKLPAEAEIYAITDAQKRLSDIDLTKYGFGSDWEWAYPSTILPRVAESKVKSEDGTAGEYAVKITAAASEKYYPLTFKQKVKLRSFDSIVTGFIDGYTYEEGEKTEKIQSGAQISDDGKTAVVPVSTEADRNGALVTAGFNFNGRGTKDNYHISYTWEEFPADVDIDTSHHCYVRESDGKSFGVDQLFAYKAHKEGVKLKLHSLCIGHYNGGKFIKDVDLIGEQIVSDEDLENCALTLYSSNDRLVKKIQILAVDTSAPSAVKNDVTGTNFTYDTKTFQGTTVVLKPVFIDADGRRISSGVNYTFESSNSKLASVDSSANAEGNHAVKINNTTGSAMLTLKVNDGMTEKSAEVGVRVVDFMPKVSTKSVTVNTAYDFNTTEGQALAQKTDTPIEIVPVSGTKISSVMFADICTQNSDGSLSYSSTSDVSSFKGSNENENKYFVVPKEGLKKAKTYYMIVKVVSDDSSVSAEYSFPIKITPKKNEVKASVKTVENYNLFFTDAKGKLALILKGTPYLNPTTNDNNVFGKTGSAEEFIWEDAAGSASGEGFIFTIDKTKVKDADGNEVEKDVVDIDEKKNTYTYSLSFTADGDKLGIANKKLQNNKLASGELTLYLKGYKDPVTVKVKLPVNYKVPKLKAYSETVVPKTNDRTARFVILDENKKIYGINGNVDKTVNEFNSDNSSFDVDFNGKVENIAFTKDGKDIDWSATVTGQCFTYNGKKSSDSTKLTLKSDKWSESLPVTLEVKVKTPYMKIKKGDNKITFNTAFESEYISWLDTNLSDDYMKGFVGEINEDKYDIISSNSGAKKLLSENLLTFALVKDTESGKNGSYYIKSSIVKLSAASTSVKPGKYIFRITPKAADKKNSLKALKFIITITNKTPRVVYKTKGKVDNLAVDTDALLGMVNDYKTGNASKAISRLSKYMFVLEPKLKYYPSGSDVDSIVFDGDSMNSADPDNSFFDDIKVFDVDTHKCKFAALAAKNPMKAGESYSVKAIALVKIGSNDLDVCYTEDRANNRYTNYGNSYQYDTAGYHEFEVKVVQSKPKVSLAKGSKGKSLYLGDTDKRAQFELNIPAGYTIADVMGALDINKDGITDVEVKAEFKEDGTVDYLYGTLTENNLKFSPKKQRKVSVPVTVKFKGRDGVTADSCVKVSFVIVP